jgi:hypothetical protein
MERVPKQEKTQNFSKIQLDLEERRMMLRKKLGVELRKIYGNDSEYREVLAQILYLIDGKSDEGFIDDDPMKQTNSFSASKRSRESVLESYDSSNTLMDRLNRAKSITELEEIRTELDSVEEFLNKRTA